MSVKVFVEIADPFVKVMQVLNEHPVSHKFLLSDTTLQFISSPASKPYWALDQFFWVLLEIPQDSNVVVDAKQSPLSFQRSTTLGGGRVSLTKANRGTPREGQKHESALPSDKPLAGRPTTLKPLTQREASACRGHPAPQSPTCRPRDTPCHYSSLSASVGAANQPEKWGAGVNSKAKTQITVPGGTHTVVTVRGAILGLTQVA